MRGEIQQPRLPCAESAELITIFSPSNTVPRTPNLAQIPEDSIHAPLVAYITPRVASLSPIAMLSLDATAKCEAINSFANRPIQKTETVTRTPNRSISVINATVRGDPFDWIVVPFKGSFPPGRRK